jgi:hypothetical protein
MSPMAASRKSAACPKPSPPRKSSPANLFDAVSSETKTRITAPTIVHLPDSSPYKKPKNSKSRNNEDDKKNP